MEVGQREFELRGGRIVLYTRADDRHGVWQCGMRLGTERKLVRRGTKTTELAEAKATAEEVVLPVAGAAGRHSCVIPSFGNTASVTLPIVDAAGQALSGDLS